MAVRRVAAWTAFVILCATTIGSIASEQLLKQPIWTDLGRERLLVYVGGFAAWTLLLRFFPPEVFVRATASVGILYACFTVGPLPATALSLILFAAWVLGRWLLPVESGSDDLIAVVTGLAFIIFVLSLTVMVRVNNVWTYAAALLCLLALRWRTTTACLLSLRRLKHLGTGIGPVERIFSEAIAMVLLAHLLLVLKPEASSDGLAMHLAIPAQVYNHGLWDFNFKHAVWSVMPMAGDWLYTAAYLLGGEFGARFMNYAALILTLSLLYSTARTFSNRTISLATVMLLLSSPLVQLVTGSLFVENIWTALVFAALGAVTRFHTTRERRYAFAAAALSGCAVSGKFGALSFVPALFTFLAWDLRRSRCLRLLIPIAAVFAVFAAPPYMTAWIKTGNPVFPFFNTFFRSPYFDATLPMVDMRFHDGLHLDTLWQITFRTSKFLESHDGAFGFQYFLLVPLAIIMFGRRWPYTAVLALVAGSTAFVLLFLAQSNVRYLYPVTAVISLAIAAAFERIRISVPLLYPTALATSVFLTLLNFYFLAAPGWRHRDFYLRPFDAGDRQRYLAESAPERYLIDEVNRMAPGEPVLFVQSTSHARLLGTAYTNSWHHMHFVEQLRSQSTALDSLRLFNAAGIRWFVYPRPEGGRSVPEVPLEWFLHDYTRPVSQSGWFYLACTRPEFEGAAGVDHARIVAEKHSTVGAGVYDDFGPYLQTRGRWTRDRQFAEAHASTLTYSDRPGDSVLFKFKGKEVRHLATRAANRGIAELVIDGRVVGQRDLYAPVTQWRTEHVISGLKDGTHLLEIRVFSKRNPASTGFFVDVDALTVN